MLQAVDSFLIRKPGTDFYVALAALDAAFLPNYPPIALRRGAENAHAFTFSDEMLIHRDTGRQVGFTGHPNCRRLVLMSLPTDTPARPWSFECNDETSLATLKISDVYFSPTDDDTELATLTKQFEWQIERLHSVGFEAIKNAFMNGGSLRSHDLNGLCRLDAEVLLDIAMASTRNEESETRIAPSPLLAASLIHRLYRFDRSDDNDALIDNLVTALTPFLPPGHPGLSVYREIGSIQQLPLEVMLHLFSFLSPPAMMQLCRSSKAAYQCIYDRQIAARMLDYGIIDFDQVGKCSAITVDVLKSVFFKYDHYIGKALPCALSGSRFDIADFIIGNCELGVEILRSSFTAAALANTAKVFSAIVKKMSRKLVIESLGACTDVDVFRFPPVMDLLQSFNSIEAQTLIEEARLYRNDLPISALTEFVGRDLRYEAVNCIYEFLLCEHGPSLNDHRHIEELMSHNRFAVGRALKICAEEGDKFFKRYMRRWPLDHAAVETALKRLLKIGRDCVNAAISEQFDSDIAFLLTHPERPSWSEIHSILSENSDGDAVWRFVTAVESHYDLSTMESTCPADDYALLVSTYFPRAATDAFLKTTVSKLLNSESLTETELPAFLEHDRDGKALVCFSTDL